MRTQPYTDWANACIRFRREMGELAFPHAMQLLTENEYTTILARVGNSNSSLTEALLLLGPPCSSSHPSGEGLALNAVLNQISRVIEMVKTIQPNQPTFRGSDYESPTLPDSFLIAIKEKVKLAKNQPFPPYGKLLTRYLPLGNGLSQRSAAAHFPGTYSSSSRRTTGYPPGRMG